jgi:Mn2+/Fe2+ NRAMP family transporter
MSNEVGHDAVATPPVGWRGKLRQVGPGIMAAATGVGAGDLVATMVAGSRYGYTLLWAVLSERCSSWHWPRPSAGST